MRSRALLAFLLAVSAAPVLADDEWVDLTSNDEMDYAVRGDSLGVTPDTAGIEWVTAVARIRDKKEDAIMVRRWRVRGSDCTAGYGSMLVVELDGTFLYKIDFAIGSGSIGSSLAESLCLFYKAAKSSSRPPSA